LHTFDAYVLLHYLGADYRIIQKYSLRKEERGFVAWIYLDLEEGINTETYLWIS